MPSLSELNPWAEEAPVAASRALQIAHAAGYTDLTDAPFPKNLVIRESSFLTDGSIAASADTQKEAFQKRGWDWWGMHFEWPDVGEFFTEKKPQSVDAVFGYVKNEEVSDSHEAARLFVSDIAQAFRLAASQTEPEYKLRLTKPFLFQRNPSYYQQVLYFINPDLGCYSANVKPDPEDQCRIIVRAQVPQRTAVMPAVVSPTLESAWLMDATTLFKQNALSLEIIKGKRAKAFDIDREALYRAASRHLPENRWIFVAAHTDSDNRLIPAHLYEKDRIDFFVSPHLP